MKKYLTSVIVVLFAAVSVSFAGPDKAAISAKENAIWQAYKDKKADDFKKLATPDYVGVYAEGIVNLQTEMDDMTKTDLKSFSLTDFNITTPDPDTVIVTYKAKVEATMNGKDESGTYNCASVWNMKGSEWLCSFHTEMKEVAEAAD